MGKTKNRKKAKIIAAVISAVIAVIGILLCIVSGGEKTTSSSGNSIDVFDPDSFKPGAHGTIRVFYDGLGKVGGDICIGSVYDEDDELAIVILEDLNLDSYNISRFLLTPDENGNVELTVSVEECPEDKRQIVADCLNEENQMVYEYLLEQEDTDPEALAYYEYMISDEGQALMTDAVATYQCRVENSNSGILKIVGTIMAVAGCMVALISVLLLKFSPKTIILGALILILVAVIVLAVALRKRISTYASVKKYESGIYSVNCKADYKLQDMLDADISSEGDLLSFVSDELFWGIPIDMNSMSFGCSSFSAVTPEGHHLMGRNYDYPETDLMMIYTDPSDGYASISMADIGLLGLGTDEGETDPLSAVSRSMSVLFPYLSVDGVNEAGVGISILQLEYDEIHQDQGKPDILMNVAIRGVLDTCGSTEEAIAFLDSYDMHTMIDRSFHLFITDTTGNSVIVEWIDNEMVVTEGCAVTNHILGAEEEDETDVDSATRYAIVTEDISACGGTADEMTAMSFLSDAALRSDDPDRMQTEWSCVYDLEGFQVVICTDTEYDQSYTVTPEDFR